MTQDSIYSYNYSPPQPYSCTPSTPPHHFFSLISSPYSHTPSSRHSSPHPSPSLTQGGIVMTNDGNCILREVDVSHPAAKSMIELSRAQDEEVGDGTTSVIILSE